MHQPPKHKDENGAFYTAQCINYGLKAPVTKAAAKKVLLEALSTNGRQLKVLQWILDLEQELKSEFAVANRVAKEEHDKESRRRQEEIEEKRLKRKRVRTTS